MKTVTEFPRPVREIENEWIPLADGCRLAARIWLPEDAEREPGAGDPRISALPQARRHGRARRARPIPTSPATAMPACASTCAAPAIPTACCTTSTCQQEQDDALEVIAWLAAQPWCTGAVGMMGISWGGFNALQVAARRPPALKAIITLCSTDDRYADDIHYMGGCLLNDNLAWGSTMLAYSTRARPTRRSSASAGARCGCERLEHEPAPGSTAGCAHQRRDAFWKHGSVCEDFAAIECRGLRRRRLGRRLLQRDPAPARGPRRAREGPDRPLGAQVPAFRAARARRSASCRRRCAGGTTG